jgi:hypothetical protein
MPHYTDSTFRPERWNLRSTSDVERRSGRAISKLREEPIHDFQAQTQLIDSLISLWDNRSIPPRIGSQESGQDVKHDNSDCSPITQDSQEN